jgi:protein-S-isoprenylcysteine O-methyltransferase Ste14
MQTLVVVLRTLSLLAFAGPMLTSTRTRRTVGTVAPDRRRSGERAPFAANVVALLAFYLSLSLSAVEPMGVPALVLAIAGCALAVLGMRLVLRSRAALGAAWSFVAKADAATGLVTSGPYRRIRHPIYTGFVVVAVGQAIAFASWVALALVPLAVLPSFVWRAHEEEALLARTFDERFAAYRRRTGMILPRILRR